MMQNGIRVNRAERLFHHVFYVQRQWGSFS